MDDPPSNYSAVAGTIGRIIIDWNYLESLVKALVYDLAVYHSAAFEDDEEFHVLFVILSNSDIRAAVASAKALAFAVEPGRFDTTSFYDRVDSALTHIDTVLRPQRNRCVHDNWQINETLIRRVKSGALVKKAPGTGDKSLHLQAAQHFQTPADVAQLHDDICESIEAVDDLIVDLTKLIREIELREE